MIGREMLLRKNRKSLSKRNPLSVIVAWGCALALILAAGSAALTSAPLTPRGNTPVATRVESSGLVATRNEGNAFIATRDDSANSGINFVSTGLTIAIRSAGIASDGTVSVDYTIADAMGRPLDIAGLTTPGPVSLSYVAAYIPNGQPQGQTYFWAYTTRPNTSPLNGVTVNAGGADSGGTLTTITLGEYLYTFKTKAVAKGGDAFDRTATHRIGIYGNRNLSEFDMPTSYADTTFDFVPNGSAVAVTRDIVRTAACNSCHDSLAHHGGNRRSVQLCIMCHQNQNYDPNTGSSFAADVMIHKIHSGSSLPSVQAGGKYQFLNSRLSATDFSTVVFPAEGGVLACTKCHDPAQGAAQQTKWMTNPSIEACGSCHDDVNFATGANHVNLPEFSDSACSQCHPAVGQYEFDASITGAHTIAAESAAAPGIVMSIVSVSNADPGKAPFVTFTVKDNLGAPIAMSQVSRMALVLAGPTKDYGYTSFGADVTTPGYVSENPVSTAQCDGSGTCTYQFTHSLPANAAGTFVIGMEGRRSLTINPGTTIQVTTQYSGKNVVYYFSVDGSPVTPRRTVVSIDKCNQCHVKLVMHGARNQTEYCVICHNPSNSDIANRPTAVVPSDKTAPAQSLDFSYLIHRVHTGVNLVPQGASFRIVGGSGTATDFSTVLYPSLSPTGAEGYTQSCYRCHVNGSEAAFPVGLNPVTNPASLVSPEGATTAACTGCHATNEDIGHALTQTSSQFGETCDICHSGSAEFTVTRSHTATTGTLAGAQR